MFVRSLLTVLILLLAVSCSESVREEPQSARIPARTPVQPPSDWYLYWGDLGKPFAWISGPAGKYPVFNYSIVQAIPMKKPGRQTIGRSASLIFELPRPLTGQDVTLEFPEVEYPFHPVRQPKITCRITVDGNLVKELTEVMPKDLPEKPPRSASLRVDIPGRFTTGHQLTIRFEYPTLKTAAELGGKGRHQPGIGFYYLSPEPKRPGRAVFLVRKSGPVKNGRQQVELLLRRRVSGPVLPVELKIELPITPSDHPEGFQPDDLVDLTLAKENDTWTALYGGMASGFQPGLLPASGDPALYYSPKRLPKDNPPLPEEVLAAQKKQVVKDLIRTRSWIRDYRHDPAREERLQRMWFQRQKQYPLIPKIISPETGQEIERHQNYYRWGKYRESFFALAKDYEFKRAAGIVHNIGAMNELNLLLRSCHIQLIVMLVPDPDRLAAGALLSDGRLAEDPAAKQAAATLLEYGIEAVYIDPEVLAASRVADLLYLYPSQIPAADLWAVLADLTADRLDARFGKNFFAENKPVHYRQVRMKTVFGDNCRWQKGVDCGDHQAGDIIEGRQVLRDGQPFQPDPGSKILVIGGDSLNLPGPGHTFTGLLSMRLKYPVDEMIPGTGVWLHNLPLILQSDPVRWLRGKQVCLMMVSARMLENGILPNLRAQMELYAGLCRMQPVHRFGPVESDTEVVLPAAVQGERQFEEKTEWNRIWEKAGGTPVMIPEDDQPLTVAEYTIPDQFTQTPSIFFAEVMCYPGQSVMMIVNGRKIPLPVENGVPFCFRPALLSLPAGTKTVKVEFSGRRGDLFRVRNVRLYR